MATTSKGTIKYKIIARKNPQEPDGAPTYYAKAVQDRSMDFEDFVSHMSDHNSPFSRGVIHGVLTDMLETPVAEPFEGKEPTLTFRPFEIKTIKLYFHEKHT